MKIFKFKNNSNSSDIRGIFFVNRKRILENFIIKMKKIWNLKRCQERRMQSKKFKRRRVYINLENIYKFNKYKKRTKYLHTSVFLGILVWFSLKDEYRDSLNCLKKARCIYKFFSQIEIFYSMVTNRMKFVMTRFSPLFFFFFFF